MEILIGKHPERYAQVQNPLAHMPCFVKNKPLQGTYLYILRLLGNKRKWERERERERGQVRKCTEWEQEWESERWGPADKWLRVCVAHTAYTRSSSVGARVFAGRRLHLPAVLGVAINGNHLVTEAVRSGVPPTPAFPLTTLLAFWRVLQGLLPIIHAHTHTHGAIENAGLRKSHQGIWAPSEKPPISIHDNKNNWCIFQGNLPQWKLVFLNNLNHAIFIYFCHQLYK